nr:MAG TPA: Baseplate wedge protein [Caudoviricetes sp.]
MPNQGRTTKTKRGIDLIDDPAEVLESSRQKISANFKLLSETLDKSDAKFEEFKTQQEESNRDLQTKVESDFMPKARIFEKPYTVKDKDWLITLDPEIENELIVEGEVYVEGDDHSFHVERGDYFQAGQYGFFAMKNPKGRWLFCDGREISRADYPELFEAIGTTYGEGDGITTFNIPDRRGYFGRCLDAGAEVDYQSDREIGSKQGDAIRNITGTLPPYDAGGMPSGGEYGVFKQHSGGGPVVVGAQEGRYYYTFDASRVVPTAPENVVKNIAEYVCIRY